MKALSITRPWPNLILFHGKDVENRTWPTAYRGPLWVHAAQSWDGDAIPWAEERGLIPAGALSRRPADHATGLVGSVSVVGLCSALANHRIDGECSCQGWAADGQHHWRLSAPQPLAEPVPCRGALGLWTPSDAALVQVRWRS